MRGTCQNSRWFRRNTLNSNRVWSSQLKQTIARFEENLATILIKIVPIATSALTTISETNSIHQTAFANLRLRPDGPGIIFDRILAMKSESVGHHAATQALVLSVAGVMAIVLIASLIILILH
jgi:hypothetical protein